MQFDTAYSHAAETGQCVQANDFGLCATAYLVGLTFVSGLQWKSYAQTSLEFLQHAVMLYSVEFLSVCQSRSDTVSK